MSTEPVNASPHLPVLSSSVPELLEQGRVAVCALLLQALEDASLDAELTHSSPYSLQSSVLVRAWIPIDDQAHITRRGHIRVTLRHRPARTHRVVHDIEVAVGHKKKVVTGMPRFDINQAKLCVDVLSARTMRTPEWIIHNLTPEWLTNPSTYATQSMLVSSLKSFLLALMLIPSAAYGASTGGEPIGVLGLGGAGLAVWTRAWRRVLTKSTGQAEFRPRIPIRFDSWQTVIIGLGPRDGIVRDQLLTELNNGIHPGIKIHNENVNYLGANESTSRSQIVVQFRRALCFIEIHGYGDDLYVDWEAHLNLGVWLETVIGRYFDNSFRVVEVTESVPSIEPLNEYDISDAAFVAEWVHACVKKVLDRTMAELKIDQEVDFKILQRADRTEVMRESGERSKRKLFRIE